MGRTEHSKDTPTAHGTYLPVLVYFGVHVVCPTRVHVTVQILECPFFLGKAVFKMI